MKPSSSAVRVVRVGHSAEAPCTAAGQEATALFTDIGAFSLRRYLAFNRALVEHYESYLEIHRAHMEMAAYIERVAAEAG